MNSAAPTPTSSQRALCLGRLANEVNCCPSRLRYNWPLFPGGKKRLKCGFLCETVFTGAGRSAQVHFPRLMVNQSPSTDNGAPSAHFG